MAFTPRTFETILTDSMAYVRANTDLTDFEIGSAVRTTLEAAALEDDEQYFQMVQLMDAFSLRNATGQLLVGRLQDYDITKLQPGTAAGKVVFQDNNLTRDEITFDTLAGASAIQVNDSTDFAALGPYTVRLGEGTVSVEDVVVASNNVSTGVFTLSAPTINDHAAGELACMVSGAADQLIGASQQVQVPAVGNDAPIKFVTIEAATIVNGNYESTPTRARAVLPGRASNIGANEISQFTASGPFSGAGVRNPEKFGGGRGLETDPEVKDRARGQLQSLSRGTGLALTQAALGVVDPVTGQRVTSTNIIENYDLDEVILYIDDGTGFTPDSVTAPTSSLAAAPVPNPGATTVTLVSAARFPASGYAVISPEDTGQIELVEIVGVDYVTNILTLASATVRTHNLGDQIIFVDVVEESTEAGTVLIQTQNFPIVRNSLRVWVDSGAGLVLQPSSAYFANRAKGAIQFYTALVTGSTVVCAYTSYAGLVRTVQKVIDGDPNDPVNYPGYASEGEIVLVETPVIRRVTVRVAITAAPGYTESDLAPAVREAIEAYIGSLKIGEDVIKAEIIQRAMEVVGVFNVTVATPTGDIVVLPNELPIPFDSLGNSLVTVT